MRTGSNGVAGGRSASREREQESTGTIRAAAAVPCVAAMCTGAAAAGPTAAKAAGSWPGHTVGNRTRSSGRRRSSSRELYTWQPQCRVRPGCAHAGVGHAVAAGAAAAGAAGAGSSSCTALQDTQVAAGATAAAERACEGGKAATVLAGGAAGAESGGGSMETTRAAAAVPCVAVKCTDAAAAGLAVAEAAGQAAAAAVCPARKQVPQSPKQGQGAATAWSCRAYRGQQEPHPQRREAGGAGRQQWWRQAGQHQQRAEAGVRRLSARQPQSCTHSRCAQAQLQ